MGNDTINKHNQQKQLKTLICGHCWRLQCNETTAISRIFMQFMHVHCCFAKPSAEAGHLIISKQTTFLDPIFIVCRHYYVHKFKLSLKILRHWKDYLLCWDIMAYLDPASNPESKPQSFSDANAKVALRKTTTNFGISWKFLTKNPIYNNLVISLVP